jgi:hypothetical protein
MSCGANFPVSGAILARLPNPKGLVSEGGGEGGHPFPCWIRASGFYAGRDPWHVVATAREHVSPVCGLAVIRLYLCGCAVVSS